MLGDKGPAQRNPTRREIDDVRAGAIEYAEELAIQRPRTRGECVDGDRPCPWVACRHHLYLDVSPTSGRILLNFPELEPHELAESCSLDIAERGGVELRVVGDAQNISRERVRQVEVKALMQVRAELTAIGVDASDVEMLTPRESPLAALITEAKPRDADKLRVIRDRWNAKQRAKEAA